MKVRPSLLRVVACFLVLQFCISLSVKAENYHFIEVMRGAPAPSGFGNEEANPYNTAPVIEGDYVVFRSSDVTVLFRPFTAIWSYNIRTKQFKKLVSSSTAVPGGTGTFTDLGGGGLGGPALKDGFVVFGGSDSGVNSLPGGLTGVPAGIFSVPVDGGEIKRLAHYTMPVPGSTTNYFNFGQDSQLYGNFSTALGQVIFEGSYGGGPIGGNGLYLSDVDGAAPVMAANRDHPWNPEELQINWVRNFLNPATNGTTNAFIGGTVFGYFGVFTSPIPATPGSYLNIVAPASVLPGETNGNGQETSVIAPSVQIDGNVVAFKARDTSSQQKGIYLVDKNGGPITKVISTTDVVDGIADISTNSDLSYGMDDGEVFFKVKDHTTNNQGYYIWANGVISKVATNTAPIVGITPYDLVELQPNSISQGRIVFALRHLGNPYSQIVVGVPESEVADVAVSAVNVPGSAKLGETVGLAFRVFNNGPGVASGVTLEVNPGSGFTSMLVPDIAPGNEQIVTYVAAASSVGQHIYNVKVRSTSFDTVLTNDSISVNFNVVIPVSPVDTLRQLAAQAKSLLSTARKTPPSGRGLTSKQKTQKAKIKAARTNLDALVLQLEALSVSDGAVVAQTETSFTAKNISALKSAIKKGKSSKLDEEERAARWKTVNKLLTNLMS